MSSPALAIDFRQAANRPSKAKTTTPFSIRFTDEERTFLQEKAGCRSLGAYIREQLLGEKAEKRRILRKPKVNEKEIAALLAGLGKSRMPSNLNQLAKAANTGTLDVSGDVEQQLQDAYAAIIAMREALFIALGLRSGSRQ